MENSEMNEDSGLLPLPDLRQLWKSRKFQKACDIVRWILLGVAVFTLLYIIVQVEYVKTMADPCAVCMEKTDATCMILPPGTKCFPVPIEKEKRKFYELS